MGICMPKYLFNKTLIISRPLNTHTMLLKILDSNMGWFDVGPWYMGSTNASDQERSQMAELGM